MIVHETKPPPPKEELDNLYASGLSQASIGKRYDASQVQVSRWMRDYGLKTRRSPGRGPDHYLWKGGIKKTKKGRFKIWKPDHPRADGGGYVYHSIWVWEEANGESVPPGHHIHHLNGVRDDDRPENLVCIKQEKHESWTFVHLAQQRVRELEIKLEEFSNGRTGARSN